MTKAQTAATAKAWTPELEAKLEASYTGKEMNDQLGNLITGKTAAAVRSKLVSMGLYEKNDPRSVGGASSTRKIEIVNAIEILLSKEKGSFASLEKASKPELEALSAALVALSDRDEAEA